MPIVKPSEMNFDCKKFYAIIYGETGIGKTTVAQSAPKPFTIDLDRGMERVSARHRSIMTQVDNYAELLVDLESDEFKECETVVIDTGGALISLMQRVAIAADKVNRQADGTISIRGHGAVKKMFNDFVGRLINVYKKNIVFLFHSVEEMKKQGGQDFKVNRILCEGSAKNLVWQPADFGGFMFVDEQGKRRIGFSSQEHFHAKGSYGITGVREISTLGPADANNFLTKLFDEARANIAKDAEFFESEKKDYVRVMGQGAKLVEEINDIETANAFAEKLNQLNHKITSKSEIGAMAKERIAELGLTWDKDKKAWVQKAVES